MQRKEYFKIILFAILFQAQACHANPFPDYSFAINLILNREFLLTVGFVTVLCLNRSCWKASYERANEIRHKYENLYLDTSKEVIKLQTENYKLKKEISDLTATGSNKSPTLTKRFPYTTDISDK